MKTPLALALCLLLAPACGPTRIEVMLSDAPVAGAGASRAGAAVVDITPPLGPSLYGHGPNAAPAEGHRGRLRCRAIYLEDPRGEALALVTCDLQSISLLLQHRLAAELHRRIGLGMDRILLSATHTHAGPAHYFGAKSYSEALSSQRPGFDPRVVAFLVGRIATGVVQARARALAGGPARVSWVDALLPEGTSRNSSLQPHCGNPDPLPGSASSCGRPNERPDRLREVDRQLTLLRVERLEGGVWKRIAVHATFAMHATAVDNLNTLYHADAFGVATALAEAELSAPGEAHAVGGVVVALASGHSGDLMANVRRQSFDEAIRIGERIGTTLVAAARLPASFTENFEVTRAFGLYALAGAPILPAGPLAPRGVPAAIAPGGVPASIAQGGARPGGTLCAEAELGNPAAGGAEDGRTAFYYTSALFQEGARDPDRPDACHRPRISFESTFKKLTLARHGFPEFAPLMVARVADRGFIAVPGELSLTAGLLLQQTLGARAGQRLRVLGYTNGYLQYITTRQEFFWQFYQGASNLWGPDTLAFVWAHLARLVASPAAQAVELAGAFTPFRLPSKTRRLPKPLPEPTDPPRVLWARPLVAGGGFEVVWRGRSPAATHPDRDGDGVFESLPVRVRIDRCDLAGACVVLRDARRNPVDDRSLALEVRYLGRRPPSRRLPGAQDPEAWQRFDAGRRPRASDRHVWKSIWYADGAAPGGYRFAILDHAGQVIATADLSVP